MHPFWLLLQGRTLPDTVVMQLVPPEPGWFERVTGVASGITSLVPYFLLLVGIVVAVRLRNSFEQTKGSLDGATKDLKELVVSTSRIAQDIASVTEMVKTDLAHVHGTVAYVSQRTRDAVEGLADRVEAFTETVAVVQEETEDVIVNGLAAVRGVRAGVQAIISPSSDLPRGRRRRAAALVDDEPDEPPVGPRLKRHRRPR